MLSRSRFLVTWAYSSRMPITRIHVSLHIFPAGPDINPYVFPLRLEGKIIQLLPQISHVSAFRHIILQMPNAGSFSFRYTGVRLVA